MKRSVFYLLGVILSLSFTFSCTRIEKEEAMNNRLSLANASRDSLENALVTTMDEINRNLDLIREKQGLVVNPQPNENISKKEEILKTISMINALLEDNKKKIKEMSDLSRRLGQEKSALVKISEQTRIRIEKQEKEIENLKILLAQEEFKVADLYNKMDEMQVENEVMSSEKKLLEEVNKQLESDLYKAYFTYGTFDELQSKGIVEKKGGFLGLGKKEELTSAFVKNRSYFSELDIREIKTIPVHGVKPKLLSTHPTGSYELKETDNGYSSLNVLSSDEFWSVSKFLIIEVKKQE